MISTILFDLDGTLIDSEPLALKAILELSQKWGVSIRYEDASFVAGKKWEVAFDLFYERYQLPLPKEEASRQIVGRYQELVREELGIVPGGADAVRALAQGGFRLALVSGSNRDDVLYALEKLGVKDHFEVILGAEDYPRSKPAPDGYQKALDMMGLTGKHALVFEDSNAGIVSAKAVGARVVAITSTNHFQHDQSQADERIQDLQGIDAEWVRKRF